MPGPDETPPLEAIPAPPPAPVPLRELPVEFRGNAKEYFGIWIVNLMLSIVTLGVYSAWAKVRRKRYFLGNTFIDGHAFDYHATGGQIFKGRVLVVGYLVIANLLAQLFPIVSLALSVPLLFLLPWVINMSLRFNARVTSYRNVRFNFEGSYGKALVGFIALPLVGSMSLGLLYPLATRYSSEYVARGHRFGTAQFFAVPRAAPIYGAAGLAVLITLSTMAVLIGAAFATVGIDFSQSAGPFQLQLIPMVALVATFLGFYMGSTFYGARVRNIVVNVLLLAGGHRFRSTLSGLQLIWILVTNFAAMVVSFGLLRPWAAVRQYRYQCLCLAVLAAGDLDGFVSAAKPAGGAFGSELADFQDIDIGF